MKQKGKMKKEPMKKIEKAEKKEEKMMKGKKK
jgi:hypothetical protein